LRQIRATVGGNSEQFDLQRGSLISRKEAIKRIASFRDTARLIVDHNRKSKAESTTSSGEGEKQLEWLGSLTPFVDASADSRDLLFCSHGPFGLIDDWMEFGFQLFGSAPDPFGLPDLLEVCEQM
jgi:hypothetical protein